MSEKNQEPTEKKKSDARKKGQVAKSIEVTSALQLITLLAYMHFEGVALLQGIQAIIEITLQVANEDVAHAFSQVLWTIAAVFTRFLGGMMALLIVVTILAYQGQTGPLLASEALEPKLDKLNVVANLKNMFSMKSLFEFCKSLLKVGILTVIFFYLIRQYAPSLQYLPMCSVECGLFTAATLVAWLWGALIAFYVVFGIADFAFQRYSVRKDLMMSFEDVKQEYKDSEGNPEVKSRRRELYHEVQSGSLAGKVKRSSVVVRNPSHIAVCLYYRKGETPLPQVLELGYGFRALHIVRLAERAGVPVVHNVPVARRLAAEVVPGQYIPPSLFEPVAHILRMAMNLEYEPQPSMDGEDAHAAAPADEGQAGTRGRSGDRNADA